MILILGTSQTGHYLLLGGGRIFFLGGGEGTEGDH